ncbi:phosphate ABC transporter substrate-binding protein [Halioxenophilus aromaticivorans]|uniref:Phosphate ABC transporter substrate-binding protein n=1 Tax=Halioxenophilus aromaticivorans TaxID=1306992 RepID=A0AAV3U2N8_9ALTE
MKLLTLRQALAASLTVLLCAGPVASFAEVAVIVHPSNSNELNKNYISRIFLGKKKVFPDGSELIAISQDESSPVRDEFVEKVVGKSLSQYRAYWAQLVFTGRGKPPKEVGRDSQVKELVAQNPALIGFIDAAAVDDSVKVVGKF